MSHLATRMLIALGLAAVLAGCGSKQASNAPASTDAKAPAAAVATNAPGANAASVLGSPFCTGWVTLAAQNAKVAAPATGPNADTKTALDQTTNYMKSLADQAPAEIKSDFQTYAKFWSDYATAMAKANYDYTRLATDPELQKAMQSLSDPKLDQAAQHIQDWYQKSCTAGR